MHAFPLRFQRVSENRMLFADDAGRAFFAAPSFADRFYTDALTPKDRDFLLVHGFAYLEENDLSYLGYLRALAGRVVQKRQLNYLIAVPTLRCDLMCSYCQVSRVNADQHGFDWTPETEAHFLRFLDQLKSDTIQIEFQGGEPLLRIDIIERVIAFCESRFKSASFVICTNLSAVNDRVLAVFARANVHVSTSLDGPIETHRANRTKSQTTTETFLDNLANVIERFGSGKVSALPTIDPANPPSVSGLLNAYESFGLYSIFLRPVSYHGFARKSFRSTRDETEVWNAYFDAFLEEILRRNDGAERAFEEFYFTLILKRCLRGGENGHVDLRNPNPYGQDYLIIDHDGRLYPADEARMLTRSGIMSLKKTKLQKIKKNKNKVLEVARDHKLTRKTAQNQGLRVSCVLVSKHTRDQVSSLISRALGVTALRSQRGAFVEIQEQVFSCINRLSRVGGVTKTRHLHEST